MDNSVALVLGEPFADIPEDLYIPPDALRVILERFTGPLDLLLYLIRKQNLDILDIPVQQITEQYMAYIDLMHDMQFELAGEYLLMAAMLAEIKSRMLLPRRAEEVAEEEDPRAELIRRLQIYEQFKQAAEDLDQLPRLERDIFIAQADRTVLDIPRAEPQVDFDQLMLAFKQVLQRVNNHSAHQIKREVLSIRERMAMVLSSLNQQQGTFICFENLFILKEGRSGVVVTFIAILELVKQAMIECVQVSPFTPIHVKLRLV